MTGLHTTRSPHVELLQVTSLSLECGAPDRLL
jgi:hypothetical protein